MSENQRFEGPDPRFGVEQINVTLGSSVTQTLAISLGTSTVGYPDHQANFVTNKAEGMRTEVYTRFDFTKYTNETHWRSYDTAECYTVRPSQPRITITLNLALGYF